LERKTFGFPGGRKSGRPWKSAKPVGCGEYSYSTEGEKETEVNLNYKKRGITLKGLIIGSNRGLIGE